MLASIQADLSELSSIHSQPDPVRSYGTRLRNSLDCALRCIHVHGCRNGSRSRRTARISAALAGCQTGISRGYGRGICSFGAWLAELRFPCLDPRRGALARWRFDRGSLALRGLLRQFVSPRTAVVSCSSRLAYSVSAETPLEERVRMADRKPKSGTLPERKARFTTLSGLPLDRLYTGESLPGWNAEESLGFPGEFPYTRGIYPTMYRGRFWTMRQYAGFGSAVESNERYRYLLDKGQMGLSVAFDLPTQIGMDSDHPLALGEVGKVGVAIDSLEDMEILFDRIPLEKVSTSMTINATASILLCLYVAVAKRQGASLQKLSGTVQNDILKEYIARGTYIYPVKHAMRIVTDIFGWCRDNLPKWNTISISGYHIREAGSTAVQEVAFTLADGMSYIQAALD